MQPQLSDYNKWWLPANISSYGAEVDSLMNIMHVFMAVLFVGWGVYFIYCLVAFRAREGHKATYAPLGGGVSKAVEAAVVVIEAVLLVVFSMPLWANVKNVEPKEKDSTIVRVIGQQFQWNFVYPGKDGKFGRTRPELIDSENMVGLDPTDPAGKDDIVAINNLRFPVDKAVVAHLASFDVIHSFKIPVLRFTQDVIPGATIKVWFQATKTGAYDIACAQLCGLGHTRMRGVANILTAAEYQDWLDKEHAKRVK